MQTEYVRIEWVIFYFHYFQLSFYNPLYAGTWPFLSFSIPNFLFVLFIILVGCMVHVHSIKFPLHIVLRSPTKILVISGNLFLWFIDTSVSNIVKSLNINFVGVSFFSVGAGLGYVTSSSLEYFKYRSFVLSNLDRWVVSAIILAYLGSVLVHYFAVSVLLYFSVTLWMGFTYGNYVPASQSSFVLSIKLFSV